MINIFKDTSVPGIMVNELGEFRYKDTGKLVYISKNKKPRIKAVVNGITYEKNAARLVLETFNPIDGPNNMLVDYYDCDSSNIELKNLFWETNSNIQIKAFKAKQKFIYDGKEYSIPDYNLEYGIYPYAIETVSQPGFYHIPVTKNPLAINQEGTIIDLRTNAIKNVSFDQKGYCSVSMYLHDNAVSKYLFSLRDKSSNNINEKPSSVRVHRLVALLFCPIPIEYVGIPLSMLQVNHIDTVKKNNYYTNLEWCNNGYNMQHARDNKLFNNTNTVLAKDIDTGVVKVFSSIASCSRYFNLNEFKLRLHLLSPTAGRIIKDNHLFKLDNGLEWPNLIVRYPDYISIAKQCDVVADNVYTHHRYLFSCLTEAAAYLNLNINSVRISRSQKGPDIPYKGWLFSSLSGHPISKKLKGQVK